MPQAKDTKVQDKPEEGKPQSEVHAEPKPAEEDSLPKDTKPRTKEQFDKLTDSNKVLKEKLDVFEKNEKKESVLDSLKPKAPPVIPTPTGVPPTIVATPQPVDKPTLVDPEGYVNATVLQTQLSEANQKATAADERARQATARFEKFEETTQIRNAYEKYPQLDPNDDKFDKKFFERTRKELIVQMVNGEKDVLKAATTVSEDYQSPAPKEEVREDSKEDAKEAKTNINAGMNRSASRSPDLSKESDGDLVKRTQKGDRDAFAERMKRAGY